MERSIAVSWSSESELELDRLETRYAAEMETCCVGTIDRLIDRLDHQLGHLKGLRTPLETTILAILRHKDEVALTYLTLEQIMERNNVLMHRYDVDDLAGLIDALWLETDKIESRRMIV